MIVRAMRSPYAFWRALLELNVLASLRLRKKISTSVSYFNYLMSNALSLFVREDKPGPSESSRGVFYRFLLAPLFSPSAAIDSVPSRA